MDLKNCFRITMAAIAITGAMVLSSCSHDDYYYSEEKAEQSVNEQYAIAFEKAFGKVGPNVDWGFGSKNANARAFTRAVGDYAQYRGNIQPTVTFPEDCAASKFDPDLTEIPSYEAYLKSLGTQWWTPSELNQYGEVYIDKVQKIKITSGTPEERSKLYIKPGRYDFTNETFDLGPNVDLYLLSGATLILNNTAASTAKFDVYIASGAELIANGESGYVADAGKEEGGGRVYNHGTITCTRFEVNTSSFLYNVGTLTTGSVNVESNPSRIVNDGIINCASVTVNAGAVQNNDNWTVTGTTEINSNNSGWVNNGHWTTNNYVYIAGSWNVINNCFLEVEEDFEMNISSEQGAFKIDGGGGVLTKNFIGGGYSTEEAVSGPFVIVMGPEAVFVVEETAQLESGRYDDEGFGIFGPASGKYAVFQAKNIVRDSYLESINSHGAVAYGGHLYVSAETHFAQGYDSDGSGTYDPREFIIEKPGFSIENNIYAAGFKSGKPDINIPETPCNPGFSGGDPNPTYRVIAEDLNAQGDTDFDFNDVVFDVEPNEAGTSAKITVLAAGGIYRLEVDGVEVHKALLGGDGQINENGFYPMINTGDGPQVDPVVIRTAYAGEFSTDANIRATIQNITVKVWKPTSKNSKDVVECTLSANRGEPASKVLVDKSFGIVPEHHSIANSYGNFTNYVQGSFQDDFWWK